MGFIVRGRDRTRRRTGKLGRGESPFPHSFLAAALVVIGVATSASLAATAGAQPAPASSVSKGAPAKAAPLSYVALGDSYTAGAGILPESNAPATCLQSEKNYPHLVAAARSLILRDASCSGATSADMTSSQSTGVAPQFDALSTSTDVVTLGIGGNDNGLFGHALLDCGIIDFGDFLNIGSPCKAVYGDRWQNDISSDASTVAGVIEGIHARSPKARVFVVGYPDILPQSGHCYPTMPFTSSDTTYLNGVEKDLNGMLKSQAVAHDASYVDTFTPSIGHDACKSSSVRWVNPIIATNGGASVHPDSEGEAEMAAFVESALSSKGL